VTELPKIVRERLRAQASGPVDVHPDADLLTAFSERTLTETERQHVIAHLALCADCRDAVALALPPQLADAEPARPQRERRRLGWAHWFALAASVVVVAAAILQRPAMRMAHDAGTEVAVATRPAPASTAAQPSAEPSPAEDTVTKERDQTTVAKNDLNGPTPSRVERERQAASHNDFGEGKVGTRTPQQPGALAGRAGIGASSGGGISQITPPPVVGGTSASLGRERRDAPSAAPATPAERGNEIGGVEESRRGATPTTSDELKSKDAEAAKLEAATDARKPSPQGALADADSTAGQKEAAAANQAALEQNFRTQPAAGAPSVQSEATMQKKQPARTPSKTSSAFGQLAGKYKYDAPLRWTISAVGKVQRSFDSGKTWQDLTIRDGVHFRAVAAQDGNVWAGGEGGALFHSADYGETWISRPLSGDAKRLKMAPGYDIQRIDINANGQVSVTTSQGQTFVSVDTGLTWSQQ